MDSERATAVTKAQNDEKPKELKTELAKARQNLAKDEGKITQIDNVKAQLDELKPLGIGSTRKCSKRHADHLNFLFFKLSSVLNIKKLIFRKIKTQSFQYFNQSFLLLD